jgi:hypothetical protein
MKWIIPLLLLMALLTPSVSAFTNSTVLSISNLNLIGDSDVLIYNGSVLVGIWNTSSNDISLDPGAYLIVLKPNAVSRLSNPVLMFSDGVSFIETYWLQIFLILGIGIYVMRQANK